MPHASGSILLHLRRRKRRYTKEEIDVLLVYVPQLDQVCWLPPDEFHNRSSVSFRVKPARNGQRKRCRMIEDYIW
jgi:hypothetical protein